MKKYKLVKCYPGFNDLGMVVIAKSDSIYFPEKGGGGIRASNITDYPNFWEEIVEKDYEILEFVCNLIVYRHHIAGKFNGEDGSIRTESHLLEYGKPHSIRRLSDGEIFTVGDNISGQSYSCRAIVGFDITKTNYIVQQEGGFSRLSKISHFKEPILTTEDGVEIFDAAQRLYDVSNKDFRFMCSKTNAGWFVNHGSEHCPHRKAWFSKEAAQKYIDLNKPKYSELQLQAALKARDQEWDGQYE